LTCLEYANFSELNDFKGIFYHKETLMINQYFKHKLKLGKTLPTSKNHQKGMSLERVTPHIGNLFLESK